MDKTDYEEPACPFDFSMWEKEKVISVPVGRIIEKEDEYFAKDDFAGAKRHLLYWLTEAETGHDFRGKLFLYNELMGLYRKTGKEEEAKEFAEKAMRLAEDLGLQDTVTGATSFLNAGTVYSAFNAPEKALVCFEKAREVLEKVPETEPLRLAGLYNNMGLALAALERFPEARVLYEKALQLLGNKNQGEAAITWLNLADLALAEKGQEEGDPEIRTGVERAESLLEAVPADERDAAYAYVLEKCAPVFDYYGYFLAAKTFSDRAQEIYGRNA